jgi:hypothetical protein
MSVNDYVSINYTPELKDLLNKIFSDEFMQKHTNFKNFEGFRYSSAVMATWDSPRLVYSKTIFDNFVKESTEYETWDDMVKAATDEAFGE